jgi:hypothetical protein
VCIAAIKAARKISENKATKPPQEETKPSGYPVDRLKQISRGY